LEAIHPSVDFFSHTRIVMGMVIGLGMTRVLMTFANIIQHAKARNRSAIHMLWLGSVLIELTVFWYSHIELVALSHWDFGLFIFFIGYAITLFLLAALLSPDKLDEYAGYEDFFIQRRHWFFGILAITMLLDLIDSFIIIEDARLDLATLVPALIFLPICALGWYTANKRVHFSILGVHWAYLLLIVGFYTTNVL
jgi:hypothetical protein